MKLILPNDIIDKIRSSLIKANQVEIGGILMGQNIGDDEFRVVDITIQRQCGTFASFTRLIEAFIKPLRMFFARTSFDYRTYNYLGEWHSHPSFSLNPSSTDCQSMFDILSDNNVGANFVVLMIVKLNSNNAVDLNASVFLPSGVIQEVNIERE